MVEWQRFRFAVAAAALFCARDAAAQDKGGSLLAPGAGGVAEQRKQAGDCAGALDAFDAALRTSITPELYRDRGACHEKLGQPFPAIEDYRHYLTGRPNAPDAEAIRARVAALEEQVGIVKPGQAGVSGKNGAEVSTSIGGETDLGTPTGGAGGLAAVETTEQLESQADASPLRRGTGFELGLAVGGRYFASSSLGGSEFAGLDLRYSLSSLSTLMLELTIGHVNSGGTVTALSGPGILAGYEARIALTDRTSDALLLGLTFRFESMSQANGYVYSFFEPEARAGYRHVFGPTLGLEAVLDGGAAFASVNGVANSGTTQAMVGGHVAALLGF